MICSVQYFLVMGIFNPFIAWLSGPTLVRPLAMIIPTVFY